MYIFFSFSTQTPPQPPSSINIDSVSHDSIRLSWRVPELENAAKIQYFVQLSGDGTKNISVSGMETAEFEDLTPDVTYSIAIKVIDMENMIEGFFSDVVSVRTMNGTPSEPRAVELVEWKPSNKILSFSWAVPMTTNGTISHYEVVYADSTKEDCDDPDGPKVTLNVPATLRNYKTDDIDNIMNSKSFIVCVRAHTDKASPWGVAVYPDGSTTGRLQPTSSSESNSSGLIVVAVVAVLAILSTVGATIGLCIVIRRNQKAQVIDRKSSHSSENGIERNDLSDPHNRPPLNPLTSIDSALSVESTTLKRLLPAQSNEYM